MKSPLLFLIKITLLLITAVTSNNIYSQSCNNNISNLHARNTNTISLYRTWNIYLYKPTFYKVPSLYTLWGTDTVNISNTCATWTVADPAIASINNGVVTAQNSGNTTLTASINGQSVSIPLQVKSEVRPVEYQSNIDPFLTTPIANSISQVPVVVICFIPTNDGVNINTDEAALSPIPSQTVDELKKHILKISKHTKFSLEEGSKFRGYKDPSAIPYVGYKIIDYIYVYEPVPRGFKDPGSSSFFGDYNVIVNRFNGRRYVDELGVKEFWVMGYHNGEIVPVESDMASPTTRDVSNSYQFPDDLPIYSKTYVLYNYNFTREGNEATHNHGHQIESMVDYVAIQQDGNTDLFRKNFRGYNGTGTEPIGRVGDTHHPPNTTVDYDYYNYNSVESDILDWKPEGGAKTMVNANTWGSVNYNWPQGTTPNVESNWYVFWMQSIPGYNNHVPYGSTKEMTNWWEFLSNWDNTTTRIGLYKNAVTNYYPRDAFVDLSLTSNWTTDAGGGSSGSSPANFTSANQIFNIQIPGIYRASLFVRAPWTISGGSKVVLNHSYGLTFTPGGSLNIGTGSEVNFNNYRVTLKSDAAGTASIGTISGSLLNATNVTVERYISSSGNRAYRLLGPSVTTTSTIRTNWQENGSTSPGSGTHITGSTTGANGFDATITGQSSLFNYNANTSAWIPASNTNATTLDALQGYLLYIRGDRTIDLTSTASPLPSNNTTLRATGRLLTGTQTFSGLIGNGSGDGFNLIANPYASAINWASVYAASTGLSQFYTYWDPNFGTRGGYVTVKTDGTKTVGTNADVNIQSGQAFFVQASGSASPAVSIQETHKSATNNLDVFRIGTQTESLSTSLYFNDENNNRRIADGVLSVYNNSYSVNMDGDDALQIANWDEDIAIARPGKMLSIESRPLIDNADTIPLATARLKMQNYEWQFTPANFSHPNLQAFLVDKFLVTKTAISLTATTIIPFSVTSNAASSAADRFMVVFSLGSTLPVSLTSVAAYQKLQGVQVEWKAEAETNIDRYEIEKSLNSQQFIKSASVAAKNNGTTTAYDWFDANAVNGNNFYRIKSISRAGEEKYSQVVRVNLNNNGKEITVYPNPLKGDVLSLYLNLNKGRYSITLTNKAGQQIYKQIIEHPGGSATQTLQLPVKLANAVYQLQVSSGEKTYTKQIIKN